MPAMSALTIGAVLVLATTCAPGVDPNLLAGIAKHESGLDPAVVHQNANGTRDWGLMQINDANFGWLGLTEKSSLDPCLSVRAAAAVLTGLSRYNTGSATRGFGNGYVRRVTALAQAVRVTAGVPAPPLPHPMAGTDLFSKPARTGGDLVFVTVTDRKD